MGKTLRIVPAVCLVLALLSGCAPRPPVVTVPPVPPVPPPSETPAPASLDDLWLRYARSLESAKYPAPGHISRQLVPLVSSTDGLVWNDQGQILMTSWTREQYYAGTAGKPYVNTFGPTWVTASPFLQRFCRSLNLQGDALRLRLAQRLGMPPTSQNDAFVQMWVDPKIFFRPCADPEITDGECTINLTTAVPPPGGPCPWEGSFEGQTSKAFTTVSQDHLTWMCGWWTTSYTGDPQTSYPWTALGYTYDWGNPASIYGESEFVIPQNSTMTIESVTLSDAYCAPAGGG